MSLEDHIAKLTAAIEKQNALTEQLLTKVPAAAAEAPKTAKPAAAEAPKTETPAAAAEDPYAISTKDLLDKITPWFTEFEKGHPEQAARAEALKTTLTKVGAKKTSEITDPDKLSKMNKWFETKMKGIRLAPDPETTAASADEEL